MGKRKVPKRSGEDKYNDWKKKDKAGSRPQIDGAQEDEENIGDGTKPRAKRPRIESTEEITNAKATAKETKVNAKSRENKRERRQRPGAALAQAQREKYAIVPSEGTRLKFS